MLKGSESGKEERKRVYEEDKFEMKSCCGEEDMRHIGKEEEVERRFRDWQRGMLYERGR